MYFLNSFSDLRLDIVGLVAILGEASTVKTARISASSWWHICPRLMPAPQALLIHERERQLPTAKGIVVGCYSGNLVRELNFFCQLLHPREMKKHEVEFLTVKKKEGKKESKPYEMSHTGGVSSLSLSGFASSATLVGLAIKYDDGWALLGIILLSLTSTLIGFASRWNLIWERPDYDFNRNIPDSDVVIHYPSQGAFRVIRCDELTHRLYFVPETVEPLLHDKLYRIMALSGTITLIFGLVCVGNAQQILQLSFAATFVFLNVVSWAISALPVEHQWSHNYDIITHKVIHPIKLPTILPAISDNKLITSAAKLKSASTGDLEKNGAFSRPSPRSTGLSGLSLLGTFSRTNSTPFRRIAKGSGFTRSMWTVIALTGTSEWLTRANIGPRNPFWSEWYEKAGQAAAGNHPDWAPTRERWDSESMDFAIELCAWPYSEELAKIFKGTEKTHKERPVWSSQQLRRLRIHHGMVRNTVD